jgi:MFS family permease
LLVRTAVVPTIGVSPHASPTGTQRVLLAYNLPTIPLMIPLGRWADMVGERAALLFAIAGFAFAGAACGFVRGLAVLIVLRAVHCCRPLLRPSRWGGWKLGGGLPMRERMIPKPGGAGKLRRLGIPAIADRVVGRPPPARWPHRELAAHYGGRDGAAAHRGHTGYPVPLPRHPDPQSLDG